MSISAFPLTWPEGFPRTRAPQSDQFKASLASALANVELSLSRFGKDSGKSVSAVVISSNVTLGQQRPADPGVAVWFTWNGLQVCIPVDRYSKVEANLQAIHHVLEARRTELRHGGLAIVRATFTGFKALPAPAGKREWWDVLECRRDASPDVVAAQYRRLASAKHPDKAAGSHAAMVELNEAKAAADAASRQGF